MKTNREISKLRNKEKHFWVRVGSSWVELASFFFYFWRLVCVRSLFLPLFNCLKR